jgi:hypothetical protein
MSLSLSELQTLVNQDSSITGFLTPEEITSCCNKAAKETGWSLPVSGDFKEMWTEERAKRHCFFMLWSQSARKFKVEQLSLNQRFSHYGELIKKMDADYERIQEERPEMFLDVSDVTDLFGTVVGTGLYYDITGKDVTRRMS